MYRSMSNGGHRREAIGKREEAYTSFSPWGKMCDSADGGENGP